MYRRPTHAGTETPTVNKAPALAEKPESKPPSIAHARADKLAKTSTFAIHTLKPPVRKSSKIKLKRISLGRRSTSKRFSSRRPSAKQLGPSSASLAAKPNESKLLFVMPTDPDNADQNASRAHPKNLPKDDKVVPKLRQKSTSKVAPSCTQDVRTDSGEASYQQTTSKGHTLTKSESFPQLLWFKRWCKRCKRSLAELWKITRQEHTLIGIVVPLDEEMAVFTRFQRLLCYYVEIQVALAASGFFISRSQDDALKTGLVALISLVLASPASLLLPWMFNTSQAIVSTTTWMVKVNHKRMTKSTSINDLARLRSNSSQHGIHDIVRLSSKTKQASDTPVASRAPALPLAAAQNKLCEPNSRVRRQSWGDQLLGPKDNKVTPFAAMPPRPDGKNGPQRMPSQLAWTLAIDGPKATRSPSRRKSNVIATRMIRKQKKQIEFNQSVRVAELKHYSEHLNASRTFMLGLSYVALVFLLCMSLCKL